MKWILGATLIAVIFGMVATIAIPAQTITPDQAILKLFPPETQGLAFIDVAALRNAPLVKEVLDEKGFPQIPARLEAFAAATGFDVRRDLDQLTIGRLNVKELLVVAQARYDRFKVEQFLMDQGAQSETYRGRAIYRNLEVQSGSQYNQGGIAFIDNLIIAGNYDSVKKAIDQLSLPGSSPLRSDLLDSIHTIQAGSQVWAVGEFPIDQLDQLPLDRAPAQVVEFLKTLHSGTYQMRVDSDVYARATGNFTSADTAKALGDMGRGLVALMKLQVAQQQDLLHLLDGIRISNSASSITVDIDAPGDLLRKLQASRGLRRSRG